MVSKASEDLPEPETPETTVNRPWVRSQSMFFRLWVRAPRIVIWSFNVSPGNFAVSLLRRRFNLCLKARFDAGQHLRGVALLRLLEGCCDMAGEVCQHHSPGFGLFPPSPPPTYVLCLGCGP